MNMKKGLLTRLVEFLAISGIGMLPSMANANDGNRPPMGFVNDAHAVPREMDRCYGSKHTDLFEGMSVLVAGSYRCQSGIGKEESYFVAYYDGQRFFIPQSQLWMSAEDRARVASLDEAALNGDFANIKDDSTVLRSVQLDEALKAYRQTAVHGVGVDTFEVYDESEYTDATGLRFSVYNPTKKTIKYVYLSVVGMNAVDDPVRDRITGATSKQLRGVGPIEPGDFGSYTFENFWFTDLVEWPRLTSLKVQYMDGTTKVVKNLKTIRISQKAQDVVRWRAD